MSFIEILFIVRDAWHKVIAQPLLKVSDQLCTFSFANRGAARENLQVDHHCPFVISQGIIIDMNCFTHQLHQEMRSPTKEAHFMSHSFSRAFDC